VVAYRIAYRISVNSGQKARNRLTAHRAARHRELPGLSPDPVALVSALRKIPEAQRRAIVLHHLAGLSVEEIARETGAPTGIARLSAPSSPDSPPTRTATQALPQPRRRAAAPPGGALAIVISLGATNAGVVVPALSPA
jgi:hypothetical protein